MVRPVSIRQSLLRTLLLLIGLLGAGALAATLLASRQTVDALAGASMRQTLEAASARLDGFLGNVTGELEILRDWGEDGLLSLDDPGRLTRLLVPVLRAHPQIASAIVADETGREHLLVHERGGTWRERLLVAGASGRQAHWREWSDTKPEPLERREQTDYDPRQRPWFRGAQAAAGELHWTEPYVFYASDATGLTAAVSFRDPDGVDHVVGFDVLLGELSEFTTALEPSRRGIGFVATAEGRLLGLPRDPRFESADARRAALLALPEDIGIPLLSDVEAEWRARGEPLGAPLRFKTGGELWWGQVQRYPLGTSAILVTAAVPEADLVGDLLTVRLAIAGLSALFLALAALQARREARRLSEPIEALARRSQRMGRGDLRPAEPVRSRILELEQLAAAQEQMRGALRSLMKVERDLQLAREIQERTLPERLPELAGFAIAAWSQPADETGGDSYDVVGYRPGPPGGPNQLSRGRARHALCLLADATGHGVGPALSVTQVRSMLRMALRSGAETRFTLRHLSEQLADDLPPGRFVTAWLGVLDAEAHTLAGFSAGQAPLFLLRAAQGRVEELGADAPPLGILAAEDLALPPPIVLEPGDLFAVLSDGVFDLTDPQGQVFGEERVREVLLDHAARGPEQVLAALRSALLSFAAGTPARDDVTALLIQRRG